MFQQKKSEVFQSTYFIEIGSKIFNLGHITLIELDTHDDDNPTAKRAELSLLNGDTVYLYGEEMESLRKIFKAREVNN